MLRYLVPHLVVSLVLTIVAGVAYGNGTIGVSAAYGLLFIAIAVSVLGAARWEQRQQAGHH